MKNKSLLLLIILLLSSKAYACHCIRVLDNSFLGHTKGFDFIVKGKIDKVDFESLTLIIEETYKGEIKESLIKLIPGGLDCMHSLDFKNGDTIIIGLVRPYYEDDPLAFMASGCITSAIYVEGEKAFSPDFQPPMYHKPRIALFRSRMSLKALERKLRRRVAP